MRGLDPRIQFFRKKMDCRVKPGNDDREIEHERNAVWVTEDMPWQPKKPMS
jgi:hypothetical protein